jgi:hypothetical protein
MNKIYELRHQNGKKVLVCHWSRPSQQDPDNPHRCWEVNTYHASGRSGCAYLGTTLLIDADPLDVARAALKQHGNDFYSKGAPLALIIVEHPTVAGVTTVIDPNESPESGKDPAVADGGRRESVLAV